MVSSYEQVQLEIFRGTTDDVHRWCWLQGTGGTGLWRKGRY